MDEEEERPKWDLHVLLEGVTVWVHDESSVEENIVSYYAKAQDSLQKVDVYNKW